MSYPKPIHWWVDNVLPLVYSEALSYMEIVGKITEYVNGLTTDMTTVKNQIEVINAELELIDPERIATLLEEMDALETLVGSFENRIEALESGMTVVGEKVSTLESDVDDLETVTGSLQVSVGNFGDRLGVVENNVAGYDTRIQNAETLATNASSNVAALGIKVNEIEEEVDDIADIANNFAASVAKSEEWFTATRNYNSGELIYIGGTLYKATANITSGDSLVIGTNIVATSVSDEIVRINGENDSLDNRLDTAESDIDAVEGRLDTAESDIDAVEGRLDTAESDIDAVEGRLDTAESDIVANEENILKAFPTEIESGSIASFADGADDLPVKDMIVNIDPVQSGSGDPSPGNIRPISGWTGCNIAVADTTPNASKLFEISPMQAGSGDPSPTNIRVITPGLTLLLDDGETTLEVYGGTLNPLTGELTVDSASRNINDLEWTFQESFERFYSTSISSIATPATSDTEPADGLLCDYYTARGVKSTGSSPVNNTIALGRSGSRGVFIRDERYSSVETFLENVGTAKVVFKLATPSIYQLTPTELSRALVALGIDANSYTISWQSEAGTVYGGTLNPVTGVLTVVWAIVDMGTLLWNKQTTQTIPNGFYFYSYLSSYVKAYTQARTQPFICSNYKNLTNGESAENIPNYAIYNAKIVNSSIVAVTDSNYESAESFASAMNGVQLLYELASPVTYHLTPIEIKTLLGQNNIWADTGNVSVEYRADPTLYMEERESDIQSSIAPIENGSTASQAYAQGEYFFHNGDFCKAKTAIASGAAFTLNTNYEVTTVAAELKYLFNNVQWADIPVPN